MLDAASSSATTRPCGSSPSAPRQPRRASRSTRRTRTTSHASASASTGCRSRSSSRPGGSARSAPAAIAERLDDRFRLLRTGSRAAPTRQQTLTATLQWSHDLLEHDERDAVPPACGLRRRLRARGGRGGLRRRRARRVRDRRRARRGSSRSRSSAVERDDGRERRYRLLETVRLYARERLDEARRDGRARGAACPLGARARRARTWLAAARPRGARTCAPRSTRCSRTRPHDALRLCVALCPFWLRRIELDEAKRRFAEALAAAPERTTLRAEALLGAAAIDFRSGTLAAGLALAEESHARRRRRSATRAREWRALQFLGEFGVAKRRSRRRGALARAALELARARGLRRRAKRSASTRSASRAGCSATSERRGARSTQSIESFRALDGSPETDPLPARTSPRSASSQPDGRPGLRLVFEDTLQPFAEISCDAAVGYVLANQAGIARVRGDLAARAGAARRERGTLRGRRTTSAGQATVLVRRAVPLACRGRRRSRARAPRARARAAPPA